MKKSEASLRDLWDTIQLTNMYILSSQKKRKRNRKFLQRNKGQEVHERVLNITNQRHAS